MTQEAFRFRLEALIYTAPLLLRSLTLERCVNDVARQSALFTPVNDFPSGKLLWVDVAGIQQWLGRGLEVQSYLIETSEGASNLGAPSGGTQRTWPLARSLLDLQDFYVMPSTHLVYAVTWCVHCHVGNGNAAGAVGRSMCPEKVCVLSGVSC